MCEFCSDTIFVFSKKESIQLTKKLKIGDVVNDAINQLHEGKKIDKATKKALWQSHNAPLQKAVGEGFTPSRATIEYNTPNYEFLKQLQTNTAVFAMFKSHASMKDMAALLKDENGNVRSKPDFIKEALKVDSKYRVNNLDAEYDTAVRQARMASKWQKYQQNKHLYPNLIYLHTKAANPDKVHLTYVGIIRPVDDPFWDTHYPPSRWRCQCDVDQTDDEPTDIPGNLPPIPDEFAFNSGKTGQVFDIENSDYIKKASPKEIPGLIRDAKKFINEDIAAEIPYQPFYKSKTGNKVEAHPIAFDNNDIDAVQTAARELANLKDGPKLSQILPDLFSPALRKKLLPDAKGLKNPDYRFDGTIYDLKIPTGKEPGTRTIKNLMSAALKQADGIVLKIPDNYSDNLYELLNQQYKHVRYKDFKMYLKYNDKWQYFTQKEWKDFYSSLKNKPLIKSKA